MVASCSMPANPIKICGVKLKHLADTSLTGAFQVVKIATWTHTSNFQI